jgi:hypothetical protein
VGKKVTLAAGVLLLLVGVLGFVEMTAPYDQNGMTVLFGIFLVDGAQNVVHIATGVVAFLAGSSYRYSRWFLQGFGIIYALMALVGFIQNDTMLGLFGVNMATNVLHLALAAAMLAVGFGGKDVPGEIHVSAPKPPGRAAM